VFPFGGSNGGRTPKRRRLPSLVRPQLSESGKDRILLVSGGKPAKVSTPQTVKKLRARWAPVPGTATARAQGIRASRAASVGGVTKRRGSPADRLCRACVDYNGGRRTPQAAPRSGPPARRGRAQRRAHRMMTTCPVRRPNPQAASHQARIVDARPAGQARTTASLSVCPESS
jgi:hypothetical protein